MLQSMTGFATARGDAPHCQWEWTLRSVNGKGLDVRFRMPAGFERLEMQARALATGKLSRGSVNASLTVQASADAAPAVSVNRDALNAVVALAKELAEQTGAAPATVDGLLNVRGVVDTRDAGLTDEQEQARDAAILAGFEAALAALESAREAEGGKLGDVLSGHVDTIETLAGDAEALESRSPEAIKARLAETIEQLVAASSALDPEKLHQEAVLAAAKADIREELDRLTAHVSAARELLQSGGAVGRDLNFLAQEFNREANTICSKSGDVALTRIGLQLKSVIDQFREQVQNVA